MKDHPIILEFRQLALNVRFSPEFEKLKDQYAEFMLTDTVHNITEGAWGLQDEAWELLRMSDASQETVYGSVVMTDVIDGLWCAYNATNGDIDPMLDLMLNGAHDGNLHREPEIPRSELWTYDAYADYGYCEDWIYLAEGGYPEFLASSDPNANSDRRGECMNRCWS